MFTIDAWLLRRVFQPIVDWLSPWCSRFYAARICARTATLCLVGLPLGNLARHQWAMAAVTLFVNSGLFWFFMQMTTRWRLEDECEARGYRLPLLIGDVFTRTLYVITCACVIPVIALPPIRISDVMQSTVFILMTIALYLAGCNPGTPRPRRVMRWAEA